MGGKRVFALILLNLLFSTINDADLRQAPTALVQNRQDSSRNHDDSIFSRPFGEGFGNDISIVEGVKSD